MLAKLEAMAAVTPEATIQFFGLGPRGSIVLRPGTILSVLVKAAPRSTTYGVVTEEQKGQRFSTTLETCGGVHGLETAEQMQIG